MATTTAADVQPSSPDEQPAAPASEPAGSRAGFEAHIQGLRAVAVGLVVLNHLVGWPVGGFIGVDVFFVISGYLITRLMLREVAATGRISIREFYARRMRRIFPMATVVLVATVAAGYALFSAARAQSTLIDALWASVFLENWHLARVGTDYFHLNDAVSPVQQYWSLSVEEQYYLVWPALLLALALLARRFGSVDRRPLRLLVGGVLAVVLISSFGWAVVQSASAPTVAYFSTATRAWELAAGALLAVVAHRLPSTWSARTRGFAVTAALVLIVLSAVAITPEMDFPGPWALLPVAATVVLLAIGHGAGGPGSWLLRSAPFQYVGAISYSLYLWHFPVIIFLFSLVERSPAMIAVALGLSIGLSAASYRLVEQPVRRSSWLSARPADTTVERARLRGPILLVPATLGVAMLVLGFTVSYNQPSATPRLTASGQPVDSATAATIADQQPATDGGSVGGQPQIEFDNGQLLQLALRQALLAEQFPAFDMPDGWQDVTLATSGDACWQPNRYATECDFAQPGATSTAVILGDSQVQAWLPGVRDALAASGYNVKAFTMPGCPVGDVPVLEPFFERNRYRECEQYREEVMAQVEALGPNLTIATASWEGFDRRTSGSTGDAAAAEWQAGLVTSLSRLAAASGRVVVLDSPPNGQSVADCMTRFGNPDDCENTVTDDYRFVSSLNGAAAAEVAATGKDVRYVPVEGWFCVDGRCPAFINDVPIYADRTHVSPGFGRFVAPLLTPILVG